MVFSSLIFLYLFLPLSLLAYFLCKNMHQQNIVLLIFSLVFYAWGEPKYVFLLMFMAMFSWMSALCIDMTGSQKLKKLFLTVSVALNIMLIGFFKYSSFICSFFGDVPAFIKGIALPIGISFYTFQLMSYTVDVYRGDAKAERSYWNVLLYAALFHQCIAGPIVRYKSISSELFVSRSSGGGLLDGIKRFTLGLAKKALLANPCGALADPILGGSLHGMTVLSAWIGIIAYMLQIYLDFSAYSDMAIGLGKMLGLHYPENFDYPYVSRSVTEFWRKWHISLSTFFRDYVYIPLGGNRHGTARQILNLLIVWSLTGLWHGASWNFVLWGLYYFAFLVLEKLWIGKYLEKSRIVSRIYLLATVLFGWIIFYFSDISSGFTLFKGLFGLTGGQFTDFVTNTVLKNNIFLLAVSACACTPAVKRIGEIIRGFVRGCEKADMVWEFVENSLFPVVLLLLSTAALVGDSYNPFIYFQF